LEKNIVSKKTPKKPSKLAHQQVYKKAYKDIDFLSQDELRPVRLMLELMKPELILEKENVKHTIVVFGSARIWPKKDSLARIRKIENACKRHPKSAILKSRLASAKSLLDSCKYFEIAREFANIAAKKSKGKYLIVTGGGPGIMEAANMGAYEAGAKNIGLNISLPHEQTHNPYISPELCFQFHYFAIRKMHFVLRSRALVVFPGGYGTMDEVFESLTLIQNGKKEHIPIVLVGKEFWTKAVNFDVLASLGYISEEDLRLFKIVDSAQEAWNHIERFYKKHPPKEFHTKK
jgi:uncharacterized protein (TIGR00730 family)